MWQQYYKYKYAILQSDPAVSSNLPFQSLPPSFPPFLLLFLLCSLSLSLSLTTCSLWSSFTQQSVFPLISMEHLETKVKPNSGFMPRYHFLKWQALVIGRFAIIQIIALTWCKVKQRTIRNRKAWLLKLAEHFESVGRSWPACCPGQPLCSSSLEARDEQHRSFALPPVNSCLGKEEIMALLPVFFFTTIHLKMTCTKEKEGTSKCRTVL